MSSSVPEFLNPPFPHRHLKGWLELAMRNDRVQEQLFQAAMRRDLYDEPLRNAMYWGSCAAMVRASDANAHILGYGFLLCLVPGSPMWQAAVEGAAA